MSKPKVSEYFNGTESFVLSAMAGDLELVKFQVEKGVDVKRSI